MVDEDFVMGYACGYNDGIGSGGGGGDVPTGDTVIYNDVTIAKQWNLTGTPFGIALFDVHSDRLVCGVRSAAAYTEYEHWDRLFVHYWLSMGLLYNGEIVTVSPLIDVAEDLILNGLPYLPEWEAQIKSVGGTATLRHTSSTSSSGTVSHYFYVDLSPATTAVVKEYAHYELRSETENTTKYSVSSVLTWELDVESDGTKRIVSYDPYWLFYPDKKSNATYKKKGLSGVPKNTSVNQLLQTGYLIETLKESLLNAGENITLEEV